MKYRNIKLVGSLICCLLVLVMLSSFSNTKEYEVDVTRGETFYTSVFGHNWEFFEHCPVPFYAKSMRGVAGGLAADHFNWKRIGRKSGNNTLTYLRNCRNNGWEPMVTANVRGITANENSNIYTSIEPEMLAQLASDWVYYCNQIVPKYRKGDEITDERAKRILAEIDWQGEEKLLNPGESITPKVVLWQIGNEPAAASGRLPSGKEFKFTEDGNEYAKRYLLIYAAMVKADKDIKVGPCFAGEEVAKIKDQAFISALFSSGALIDFITYQPYKHIEQIWPNIDQIEFDTRDFRRYWMVQHDLLVDALQKNGYNTSKVEFGISEYNLPGWGGSNGNLAMARALSIGDVMLSMAEKNYIIGSVWDDFGQNGVEWPIVKIMRSLSLYSGSVYLKTIDLGTGRIYVTYDEAKQTYNIWAFNFDNKNALDVSLNLKTNQAVKSISYSTLKNVKTGKTNLLDRNTDDEQLIDWTIWKELASDKKLTISINPAEINHYQVQLNGLSKIQIVDRKLSIPERMVNPEEIASTFIKKMNASSVKIESNPIKSPEKVTASLAANKADIALSWEFDSNEDIDGFMIERSEDLIAYSQLAKVGRNARLFIDSICKPGKAYWYNVKVYGKKGYSNSIRSFGQMIPGEETLDVQELSKLYPVVPIEKPLLQLKNTNHYPYFYNAADAHYPLFWYGNRDSLAFNGINGYAQIDDFPHVLLGLGREASFSVKFKTSKAGTIFNRIGSGQMWKAYNSEIGLTINAEGFPTWNSAAFIRAYDSQLGICSKKVNDDRWHTLTLVFNDNTGSFWLDGEKLNSFYTVDWNMTQNRPFTIGASKYNDRVYNFFQGEIRKISIYQRCLTENEIIEFSKALNY